MDELVIWMASIFIICGYGGKWPSLWISVIYTEPISDKLLPDLLPQEQHVSTLDLDLNERLIHYIWTAIKTCYQVPGWEAFQSRDLPKLNRNPGKVLKVSVFWKVAFNQRVVSLSSHGINICSTMNSFVTRSSTSGKYKTSDVRFQLNSLRVLRI
ncbi:hypothetical protein JHK82_023222 [Glycine max]|uniref:Uncharacterized protein n=1 Tax=Glycine max TaxID=3847 RepID=A0A0R0IZ94_SOYBN|nr:hypothetical protein JHK87_023163 [Glycine soja]KAG5017622.1 hypothetical protein JHK85_023758 [Glycine max]KAG5027372.1 hypothetical protein JHK86_023286 [Glycine max]KAG5138491.1 hypothetical protein JHK82_023222 [Glycine max]KAH1054254.1 hypothetical protein GYH30_023162 [Glycine max]